MKIQYKNKVAIDLDPLVPEINKVTDGNMNEIKTVVNANADQLDDINETVTDFVSGTDTRLGDVENAVDNINTDIDGIEDDIQTITSSTYTKTETNNLLNDKANVTDLNDEITNRENADVNLQNQIDAISASSDVVDIVGTYQDLLDYDTTKLGDNDIIKVLDDSTHSNATSYFRWKKHTSTWQYIGSEGPYYTKGETDNLLNDKVDKETGKGLSENDFTNELKSKLEGIEAGAQVNTVTGVKGNSESSYRTGNINITKGNIGLGNVDNTSDLNKPISTATQNALNNKANTSDLNNYYTKTQIDSMIGDINTALDLINGEVIS